MPSMRRPSTTVRRLAPSPSEGGTWEGAPALAPATSVAAINAALAGGFQENWTVTMGRNDYRPDKPDRTPENFVPPGVVTPVILPTI